MKCYLCGESSFKIIKNGVRDNENLNVIECTKCSLVTLNDFSHIDDTFYRDSKMHSSSTSIQEWLEQTDLDDLRRFEFLKKKIKNKKVLDFGCGNGGFLFKCKDYTSEVIGIELEIQFKDFFKEKNLKVFEDLSEINLNEKFDLITAFHVFEHLKDPLMVLNELKKYLAKDGEIIIEVPNSNDILLSVYKSENFSKFTYWSQHLFLFNEQTLKELIKKSNLNCNWIRQIQRYSLANHLYWLSKGLPGGHLIWKELFPNELNNKYAQALALNKTCDTLIASIKN